MAGPSTEEIQAVVDEMLAARNSSVVSSRILEWAERLAPRDLAAGDRVKSRGTVRRNGVIHAIRKDEHNEVTAWVVWEKGSGVTNTLEMVKNLDRA